MPGIKRADSRRSNESDEIMKCFSSYKSLRTENRVSYNSNRSDLLRASLSDKIDGG
jgi:hypothetical protein